MTLQETCETYYNMVYRRCLFEMNFNEKIAEEVTQQVFLVLCEKWTMLKYHPNLQGWLLKTAYYKLKKAKSEYARSMQFCAAGTEAQELYKPENGQDIYEQLISRQLEKDLEYYMDEVYSRLTESEKILLGYLREGMKHAEIAERMGTTEGAISMRAVRLYRKVRTIVKHIVDNII